METPNFFEHSNSRFSQTSICSNQPSGPKASKQTNSDFWFLSPEPSHALFVETFFTNPYFELNWTRLEIDDWHGLWTSREEIAFTAWPKIQSKSQFLRHSQSIFCLPHWPNFSDILDLCLHWESVVLDDRYSRFHAGRHLIIERCFFMNIHLNRLVYMLTAAIIVRYFFFSASTPTKVLA